MAVLGLLFITVGHGVWCDFNQRSGGGQSKVGGGEAVGVAQIVGKGMRWGGANNSQCWHAGGGVAVPTALPGRGEEPRVGRRKGGRERERDWRGDKVSVASVSRGVVGLPLWRHLPCDKIRVLKHQLLWDGGSICFSL
jgi:hypothetical protein